MSKQLCYAVTQISPDEYKIDWESEEPTDLTNATPIHDAYVVDNGVIASVTVYQIINDEFHTDLHFVRSVDAESALT